MNRLLLIITGVVVVVGGFVAFDAMYTVHQTRQALVLQFGRPVTVEREPGLHFKLPLLQEVEYFDRRILDLDPPAQEVILADQKRINIDAFMRYRIVDPLEFKRKALTQLNFIQLFGSQLNASVRAEVGRILLGDMLSERRDDVMTRITERLKKQAPDFGIEVVDVRIGRTDLPQTTSQSVYNRMRSQRVAQAAQLRSEGAEVKVVACLPGTFTGAVEVGVFDRVGEVDRAGLGHALDEAHAPVEVGVDTGAIRITHARSTSEIVRDDILNRRMEGELDVVHATRAGMAVAHDRATEGVGAVTVAATIQGWVVTVRVRRVEQMAQFMGEDHDVPVLRTVGLERGREEPVEVARDGVA